MKGITSKQSVCARVTERLTRSVGAHRYNVWFDQSARFQYHDGQRRFEVAVPNDFVANWIGQHFRKEMCAAVADELGDGVQLEVQVQPDRFAGRTGPTARQRSAAARRAPAPATPRKRPTALRHRLEDFVVGASNALAFAAARRLADEEPDGTGPLFIHGGVGLGKTHLLQGICRRIQETRQTARVRYVPAEQFTNEYIDAVREHRLEAFRKAIRRLDLLAIDDVQFIANKEGTQREFLHTFDALDLGGARVVMASNHAPKAITKFTPALVSRCLRGMVVQVTEPDTATRFKIVQQLAARRGLPLIETAVAVLAGRCRGSVREIEGTLTKLEALASLTHGRRSTAPDPGTTRPDGAAEGATDGRGAIGHALIHQLFNDHAVSQPRRPVRFDAIVDHAAVQLGVERDEVLGHKRQRLLVVARSVAVYLARELTTMSYPEIATAMGRNGHSSAVTADQRVRGQLARGATVKLNGDTSGVPVGEVIDRIKQAVLDAA